MSDIDVLKIWGVRLCRSYHSICSSFLDSLYSLVHTLMLCLDMLFYVTWS